MASRLAKEPANSLMTSMRVGFICARMSVSIKELPSSDRRQDFKNASSSTSYVCMHLIIICLLDLLGLKIKPWEGKST